MNDRQKKISVTYGAFSCTLEGVEDPFVVLTQIVEYFRSIAREEPGFGASPVGFAPGALTPAPRGEGGYLRMAGADEAGEASLTEEVKPMPPTDPAPRDEEEAPQAALVAAAAGDSGLALKVLSPDAAASDQALEEAMTPSEARRDMAERPASEPEARTSADPATSDPAAYVPVAEGPELDAAGDAEDSLPAPAVAPEEAAVAPPPGPMTDDPAPAARHAPMAQATARETAEAPLAGVEPAPPMATGPAGAQAPGAGDRSILERIRRARARVIKIRRADLEAEVQSRNRDAWADEEWPEPTDAVTGALEPALRDATLTDASPSDDEMERLLKQTDSEMAEPENQRRLASIQQVRAAVAATSAARREGEGEAAAGLAPQAAGARPAPLLLEPLPAVVTMASVSTSPVPGDPEALYRQATEEDFLDLAADRRMGTVPRLPRTEAYRACLAQLAPKDMVDHVEAAAAYLTVINGRQFFSSSQLIELAAFGAGVSTEEEGAWAKIRAALETLMRDGILLRHWRGLYQLCADSDMRELARLHLAGLRPPD